MSLLHRITPPLGFLRCLLPLAALGAVALFAPRANAQITFTVNSFTNDSLSITLNPGTLRTTGGGGPGAYLGTLKLVDANGTNTGWANFNFGLSGGGDFGSAAYFTAYSDEDSSGDYLKFSWTSDLSAAGNLTAAATFTVTQTGMFNAANVAQWALYWGDPAVSVSVLQSIGNATTGATSTAVPEPSTYAAILGAFALGFVAWRRRQSQVPATTA